MYDILFKKTARPLGELKKKADYFDYILPTTFPLSGMSCLPQIQIPSWIRWLTGTIQAPIGNNNSQETSVDMQTNVYVTSTPSQRWDGDSLGDVELPVLVGPRYMEEITSQPPPTQSTRSSTSDTTIILPDLPLVFQTFLKGKSYAGRYFGEPCQGDLEGEFGNADNTDPTCGPAAGTNSTSQ